MDTQRFDRFLDALESGINTASDFASEQAPMVVQEYLAWQFWYGVSMATGGLAIVLLIFILWLIFARILDWDWEDGCLGPMTFIFVLISLFPVGLSVEGITKSAKVTIAPRVMVLEKIAELSHETP